MRQQSQRGVTLIELLVAITLLTLLSAGMLFAMQIGLSTMGRTNKYFASARRVLSVDRIITKQIAGFVPTPGFCRPNPETQGLARVMFFQGDAQTMRFISTYSLHEAARGLPRILEFQVIPGELGEGVRLVVNETLYTGPFSTVPFCAGIGPDPQTGTVLPRWNPVVISSNSFVLADKLASCQFRYLESMPDEVPDVWHSRWPREFNPAAVRIDWVPLRPDPSHLQLPPVALPLRPTRRLLEYSD